MLWSIISVLFAVLAAVLWGCSAFVNVPVLQSGYGMLVSVMRDGTRKLGEGPFYAALTKVSHLNAVAAAFACLSAISQIIAIIPQK